MKMAGFADSGELKGFQDKGTGFRLGAIHPDHGQTFNAAINDDRHLFMVAGSRAGKGTTMIIPNLIEWEGGVLCIDPKGENASITAMRRGTRKVAAKSGTSVTEYLGQNVAVLDPFGTVRGPARIHRCAYDPINDIEIGKDEEASQILALAEAIVISDQGAGSHFTDSAKTILAGLIETVAHKERGVARSLTTCRKIALQGYDAITAYMTSVRTPAGLAEEAHGLLDSVGGDEGGSFISTLSRQIKWMADPRVQRHLRASDFSLVKAMRENWTVYICIPPSRIPNMKRWLRVIVRMALDAKMNSPLVHRGPQTLFLLDEFYALGNFQLIEDSAAYMAGYGIKLLPVIQNIGQIKKLYEKNWETFLGNAGAIIAWGLNDMETEKYISDRMGPVMGWERTFGESRSKRPEDVMASNVTRSENLAKQERAIRWPNEIHYQGARTEMRAFVISADGYPFTIKRVEYMKRSGEGVFDSPDFIQQWEAALPEEQRNILDRM